MDYIARPSRTLEIVNKYGLNFKKGLGQNFLVDLNYLQKIISAAAIEPGEKIIEIGPGIGSLTQFLLKEGARVIAVEKDELAVTILNDILSEYIEQGRLKIIKADALELSWRQKEKEWEIDKLVANLPYNIATPLITRLLQQLVRWKMMVFMVQKEVGERMMARPGTKAYGSLSVVVQYFARVEKALEVPPGVFIPRPKVDSLVLRFLPHTSPPVEVVDEAFFFKLVKAAFHQRRKTLRNSLLKSPFIKVSPEEVDRSLEYLNLNPRIRGEELSLQTFGRLCGCLINFRRGNN